MTYLHKLLAFTICILISSCHNDYEIPHATVVVSIDVIETPTYAATDLEFNYMRKLNYKGENTQGSIAGFSLNPDLLDAGQTTFDFDLARSGDPLILYAGIGEIEAIAPRFLKAKLRNKVTGEIEIIETCVPQWMELREVMNIEAGATYSLTLTMDLNEIHIIDSVRAVDFTGSPVSFVRQ